MPDVLLDFEQAAIQAAGAVIGEENLGGCYFHFSQANMKHVQSEGLSLKYAENAAFRMRVGRFQTVIIFLERSRRTFGICWIVWGGLDVLFPELSGNGLDVLSAFTKLSEKGLDALLAFTQLSETV